MTSDETWARAINVITIFTEDLGATRQFYLDVFKRPLIFEDPNSAVFDFGSMLVNLLAITAAPELVEPAPIADPGAGARTVLTVTVDDVDAVCAELAERGVELVNGPMDRPWGPRTASFRDPSGQIWEVAK